MTDLTITDYASLVAAITEYLGRENDITLTARIPTFIQLTENKLNRDLKCIQMETRSTASVDLTSNEPEYITLPANFQTMRRIRLSSAQGKPRLEFKSGTQADEYRTQFCDVTSQPRYFTIFGTELELIPSPDLAYTIEMVYRTYLPALSASNTTNWLLLLAPDIYLYGALLESAPYTKEDARIQTWAAGFKYAFDSLNQLGQDQAYGSGPLVISQTGITP